MSTFEVDITQLKTTRHTTLPIDMQGTVSTPDFSAGARVCGTAGHVSEDLLGFEGRLTAEVSVLCARCLAEVTFPYEADISFSFTFGDETCDGDETLVVSGNVLDLEGVLSGIIRADIPISVLCMDDCKGLCPVCGNNLNEKDCKCEKELLNPVLKITDFK